MANVRSNFFKDGTRDFVSISIIGDPNTSITKVQPEHLAQFPREWAAYQAGAANIDYGGTDLTEVPGITANAATALKLRGIHNAEMLAALSDAAALGLGMGGITQRNTALLLLKAKGVEVKPDTFVSKAEQAVEDAEPKRRGRPPKSIVLEDHDLMPVEE